MSKAIPFIKKHWLILALFIGSLVAVNWIVVHKRAPGSMTVIEAQSMDMTDMRAPIGVMPVDVEPVRVRSLQGEKTFPATVSALTEEEVVARVPGRLSQMLVYPGDRVKAGQLLATIDAPEYDSQVKKAQAMSGAKSSEVISAERMIEHHKNLLDSAKATQDASAIAKSKSETEVEAAALELRKAGDEVDAAKAGRQEQQASLTYAEQELKREHALYQKGAVALDEVQASQRDRDTAAARLQSAGGALAGLQESVQIAEKRLKAAKQSVSEADAQIAIAKAGAGQAQEGIAQAHADANAVRFEASAAAADTANASTFADYRQLKAMADGVVSERLVSPGTPVTAGQILLKLTSTRTVRVQADIPQSLSGSVRMRDPVLIRAESIEKQAKLSSVFPTVDPQTRTFRVEALVANADGALRPGMFAHLSIQGMGKQVLAVRTAAIQSEDGAKFVWLVRSKPGTGSIDWTCTMHPEVSEKGPGKCPKCAMDLVPRSKGGNLVAHRATVTIGESSGDYTEVRTGLTQGDQVICSELGNLIEGTPVKPSEPGVKEPENPPIDNGSSMPGMPGMKGMSSGTEAPKAKVARKIRVEYACPMDKDVVSKKPGKCPKCGMELVKREVRV